MSKIDKYNIDMYPSVTAALCELIISYKIEDERIPLVSGYTNGAYEDVSTFLCLNDIKHTFTVGEINPQLNARIILVSWEVAGETRNLGWWEIIEDQYYIVSFDENWSDEMDVSGFALYSAYELANWNAVMKQLREAMDKGASFDYYFGTNEYNSYEEFDEFNNCFTVRSIDSETVKRMRKALGIQTYYGIFPGVDNLNCYLEDIARKEADE